MKNQINQHFGCAHGIGRSQPMKGCNGTCFQRNICQPMPHIHHPIHPTYYPMIVQPCSTVPLIYNPSFNHPYHQPFCCAQIKTKQKSLDPSSYRVTVRRITPSHVAAAAAEAYRTQKNKDSDRNHFETTQTNNIYENDHLHSNNQNIPSVPLKKIVSKNNGIQVSSTSFITTADDQKSFIGNSISEKSSEQYMMHAQTINESSSPVTQVNKSINHSVASARTNSVSSINNIINHELLPNQMIMKTSEDIDDVFSENQIIKQIESTRVSVTKEHSSIQPQLAIDKAERHERDTIKEKFSPLEISNELNSSITESPIEESSIHITHPLTLPPSVPPNIDKIKSNEMLIYSYQSLKSITSLSDIRKSSLPLRTARSTLDFG